MIGTNVEKSQSNSSPEDIVSDDSQRLKLCYEIIKNEYEFTFKNRANLDEKASKIIIFSGIVVSVYSGIGGLFLKDLSKTGTIIINKYNLLLFIFLLGISFLIISIFFALNAYKPEIWYNVPSAKKFHEKYVKKEVDIDQILDKLTSTTVEAIQGNQLKMENKVNCIKKSYWALRIGIVLCTIFIILIIFNS